MRYRNPMACRDTTNVSFDDALRGLRDRDMGTTLPYVIPPTQGINLEALRDLPLAPIIAGGFLGWLASGLFPTRLLGIGAGILGGYWWAKRQP